jgi:hypothetical protein
MFGFDSGKILTIKEMFTVRSTYHAPRTTPSRVDTLIPQGDQGTASSWNCADFEADTCASHGQDVAWFPAPSEPPTERLTYYVAYISLSQLGRMLHLRDTLVISPFQHWTSPFPPTSRTLQHLRNTLVIPPFQHWASPFPSAARTLQTCSSILSGSTILTNFRNAAFLGTSPKQATRPTNQSSVNEELTLNLRSISFRFLNNCS